MLDSSCCSGAFRRPGGEEGRRCGGRRHDQGRGRCRDLVRCHRDRRERGRSRRRRDFVAPGRADRAALHDVATRSIDELRHGLADLLKRCGAGSLRSSEMSDPTITVTNLGDQGWKRWRGHSGRRLRQVGDVDAIVAYLVERWFDLAQHRDPEIASICSNRMRSKAMPHHPGRPMAGRRPEHEGLGWS